jgi:hypothetical protein
MGGRQHRRNREPGGVGPVQNLGHQLVDGQGSQVSGVHHGDRNRHRLEELDSRHRKLLGQCRLEQLRERLRPSVQARSP